MFDKNFTQDFRTQRRNYDDGDTRIGELGRLWYDSKTHSLRISDGSTPGGILLNTSTTDLNTNDVGSFVFDGGGAIAVNGNVVINGGGAS